MIIFIFSSLYLVKEKKNILWLFGLIFGFFLIAYSVYNIPFLREKINKQTEVAVISSDNSEFNGERLGALLFDLYYIKKHPLIGNGWHATTRYADHPLLMEKELNGTIGNGNGFSNVLASMGIPFLVIYLFMLYRTIPFRKKHRFIFIPLPPRLQLWH